ncbi:MAG: pyridoxamine kinase [Clostridium sp.]
MVKEVKRVAVINDLSGIGGCSLTAAIPILSCIGVQSCPFPTAILSNQTNYKNYYFKDLTNGMEEYKRNLNKLNLNFHGIYSGFLGSVEQIDIVLDFINEYKNAVIIIDPVMGDNGEKYDTYTVEMCNKMKRLVAVADVVTPNITEACILTGKDYNNFSFKDEDIKDLCKEVVKIGAKRVVITGVNRGNKIYNYGYDSENNQDIITQDDYNNTYYSGTGDIFSSIICGYIIKGESFEKAIYKASDFIKKSVEFTMKFDRDTNEGIIFEPMLKELIIDESKQ